MKIAYIANHRSGGNDDEGAIAYSLRSLGCEVHRIQESSKYTNLPDCDFVLFHHQRHLESLGSIPHPKVFWFFDVIDQPSLPNRYVNHLTRLMNLPALGFCTDGDWALKHDGIHQLMQGADERYTGKVQSKVQHDILFAGSVTHPPDRHRQIKDLERTYGDRLLALYPDKLWTFGRKFAKKIAESKIVISLRLPASDNYWSNRVYVVSGFGGFLIHPYCKQLANHYVEGEEIVFYRTEDELKKKIDYYLPLGEERKRISANALQRTLQEHTYTHRCKQLIRIVKEQLL